MALPTSFSPSSSSCSFSSSSFSNPWEYDVFLNFRGSDTRYGFIGHLHKALCDKGIGTFIDDEELQKGEKITPSLAKAIEESRIAIPVFSENYAFSAFCLDELVKIMECVQGKGRLVLPVFYKVDPSDVRRQRGSYGEALSKHEERFKDDDKKVQRWRQALHQAANLSGEHFNGNGYERDLILKIVKEISKEIRFVPLPVAKYPVGLQSRVLEVNQLLNDGSQCGVHMVGIYGIGGIGKTTLAKAVYNSVADQFESLCFIENMSELSDQHGLVYLQETVLSKILGHKVCNLGSAAEGFSIIQKRLRCKKVLLVLDNVDKHEHLQAIVSSLDGLGSRSRVIITTRNKHLLTTHKVKKVYEVGILNEKEAVELFSRNAFEFGKGEPCYMDILKKLVTYASGLPLALEVIGSNLFGKSVKEWRSALDVYKKVPDKNVQETLKVSYKGLNSVEQKFFLDIACCFKGYELAKVEDILHANYDVDPRYTIQVLVDKSLIKINNGFHDVITLHDLIQEMGREIVRSESPEKLEERSRLWLAKDIIEVLQSDNSKGSSKIQVINLECDYNGDVIQWDGQAFGKMENLRTLIIRKCKFSQGPTHLPNSLRVLIWDTYSSEEFLPSYFNPKHLAMLELPRNCFDSVCLAELFKKKFENMRILKLDYYKSITKIPNLSNAPKLEVLSFAGCDNLTEIDESVGSLAKLKTLNATACRQLRSFPPLMLPSLEGLGLDGCINLESFPEILGKMEKMTELCLSAVPIKTLPCSIHNLTGLQSLSVWSSGIFELTSAITLPEVRILSLWLCEGLLLPNEDEGEEQVSSMSLSNKTELHIIDCKISSEFLRIALPMFPRLQSLRLERENFTIVPECIGELQFLRRLHLIDCEELAEIRGIPPNIEELFVVNCRFLSPSTTKMLLNEKLHEEGQDKTFILPRPRLPMWFEYWRRGLSIGFWFRNKFPAISFGLFTRSDPLDQSSIRPTLTINGGKSFQLVVNDSKSSEKVGHILIFSKIQAAFRDQVGEALSENEWNHAVLSVYDDLPGWCAREFLDHERVGIHIIKEKSCMDDIIFTDPLLQECDTLTDMGDSPTQIQFVQHHQLQTNSIPLERQVGQGRELLSLPPAPPSAFINYVNRPSNSKETSSTTTTVNVQGGDVDSWINRREWLSLRSCLEALLYSNLLESKLMQSALSYTIMDAGSDVDSWMYSEDSLSLHSCLENLLDSDILKSNLVRSELRSLFLSSMLERLKLSDLSIIHPGSDVDSWIYRKNWLSLQSCLEELLDRDIWESNLVPSELRSLTVMDPGTGSFYVEELAGAVLDHLENCRIESSQAPSYAETQNIQVPYYPSSTSSSGVVCGEEPHLKTCCTVFPTTTEESLRNQVEQSQEHVEMESSGTHILSHSHDHSSTIATSEDSKDALKLVQDFTTNVPFTNPNPLKSTEDNEVGNQLTLLENGLRGVRQLSLLKSNMTTSCEPVDNAKEKEMVALTCKSNAAEDGGKKPITENLSTTKAMSGSFEPPIHSENIDKPVNSLIEIQPPSPQPLDPLAELERVLLGDYDPTLESTSPTAASSDFQASEVVIILQNLEPLLDNPLESLIADGEIKHQILDCLSKLGLLEDHIPLPLQSIVAQIKDFYEDLIHNFPSIQRTLVDYSCLEETRSKILENLKQAKVKQAQIDAEASQEKNQLEELDAGIADLEIKLKAAVAKRNELQLAIKNGEVEKNKILKDASAWLMESKRVAKKMRSSEHAFRDAQNSKARLEGRLATLKAAFAANNDKP